MQVRIGERYARCPYCGGTEFVLSEDSCRPPVELACAHCGGVASRKVLLERTREELVERLDEPPSPRGGKG